MSLAKRNLVIKITNTQPAFTCPKSTTETVEQGANHTHSRQYRYQHDATDLAPVSSLPTPSTTQTPLRCLHCQPQTCN